MRLILPLFSSQYVNLHKCINMNLNLKIYRYGTGTCFSNNGGTIKVIFVQGKLFYRTVANDQIDVTDCSEWVCTTCTVNPGGAFISRKLWRDKIKMLSVLNSQPTPFPWGSYYVYVFFIFLCWSLLWGPGTSVVDPNPVGSEIICRIRIRNY